MNYARKPDTPPALSRLRMGARTRGNAGESALSDTCEPTLSHGRGNTMANGTRVYDTQDILREWGIEDILHIWEHDFDCGYNPHAHEDDMQAVEDFLRRNGYID